MARIGILGGRSFVGRYVVRQLADAGNELFLASRRSAAVSEPHMEHIALRPWTGAAIPHWISIAPIWAVEEHRAFLASAGVKRLVALSSTSRFTKMASADSKDAAVAARLIASEDAVAQWARDRAIELTILRPTMIYGDGLDQNVSEIARMIKRFGFFPMIGPGNGLRQPVHAADVASAAILALQSDTVGAYQISGGEVLSYRQMVARISEALGRRTRILTVPRQVFVLAIALARLLPRYAHLSAGMADRMATDMVFDNTAAKQKLNWHPRRFDLLPSDLPRNDMK